MVNDNNTNIFLDYLPFLIGWFMGIMSAMLIEIYKKHSSKQSIKRGIKTELNELKLRLASMYFIATLEHDIITNDWASWIKPYYKLLIESDEFDYLRDNQKPKLSINKLSDNEFLNLLEIIQTDSRKSFLKFTQVHTKILLPYINSNYSTVSLLKKSVVKNIAKLQRDVSSINSEIDQIWFYHTKTFENLSDTNREIVNKNIEDISLSIARKAKYVIKLTENIF